MTTMKRCSGLILLAAVTCVTGFAPVTQTSVALRRNQLKILQQPLQGHNNNNKADDHLSSPSAHDVLAPLLGTVAPVALLTTALPAHAADGGFVLASATVAYLHYAAILACVGVLVTERILVKPDMTFEEEELLWKADALYGVSGLALAVTGYYRAVEYGKGWEFYAHEPLFWAKLVLVGIAGASSFFPTLIILQRVLEQRNIGVYPPLSESLAARMIQVINAELLAIGSIPLVATLMSRGVLYGSGEFPWQVGAGLFVTTFGGFGYKYVKEALSWKENEELSAEE